MQKTKTRVEPAIPKAEQNGSPKPEGLGGKIIHSVGGYLDNKARGRDR